MNRTICLACACSILLAAAMPSSAAGYAVQVIPVAPEVWGSAAIDINSSGDVLWVTVESNGISGAFVWKEATDGPNLALDFNPAAISNSGLVAGTTISGDPSHKAVLWSPGGTSAYLDGLVQAFSVNDSGLVIGVPDSGEPTLWYGNGLPVQVLAGLDNGRADAADINSSGEVVWASRADTRDDNGYWQTIITSFRWNGTGPVQQLQSPFDVGVDNTYVSAINDVGSAAGMSGGHSVIWRPDGSVVDLGLGRAWGMNNLLQVVGVVDRGVHFVPVVWEPDGSMVELPLPAGCNSARAYAINEHGTIVGQAYQDEWGPRAVIWNPVPEPSSLLALAVGIGGIGLGFVRRPFGGAQDRRRR